MTSPADAAPLLAADVAGGFKWGPFLAPFHSVLLHYPIGFVTLAVILEVYSVFRPDESVKRINRLVLHLCVVSAVVVIVLGLLRASDGGYEEKTLSTHRIYGIAVGLLLALTWVAQKFTLGPARRKAPEAAFRGLLVATLFALVVAGHAGGNLTHGSNYLVKNAPQFVKSFLENAPEEPAAALVAMNEEERFYLEKIKPLFDSKCLECHGREKQKGGYRIDRKDIAMKGGESGSTAIKPGDPMSSNLVRLLLLPRENDDAMPPTGKAALTSEEVMEVVQWIQKGAPFPEAETATTAPGENERKSPTPKADAAKTEAAGVAATGSATSADSASPSPAANGPGKVDFAAQIQPIFEQTCVNCHGAEKQKGKLRLDSLAAALKGGDNGPSIVPGKAAESLLIKRLLINPAKDEDEELMPPAKKGGPLEKSQVELVRRWIDEGAVWPKDVMLQAKAEPVK